MKMHLRDVAALASVLSSLLLLTSHAHAQDPAATPDDDDAAAPAVPSENESGKPDTAGATVSTAAAPVKGPPASETEIDSTPVPPPLALERLPATAYPKRPLPGLHGGSLELSINHLQWPYMPKYEGQPDFRIAFSGSSWVDTSIRSVNAGSQAEANQLEYRMQGRLTLRASAVYNRGNDWFIQSNTEFVANTEQNNSNTNYVDVDDAYLRVGKWRKYDITVGRLQGFEVYHFGMGLDLNTYERLGAASFSKTPQSPYALDDQWDRGVNNGAVALHWYVPEWLRLEFLTRIGVSGQGKEIGIRPVAVIDLGFMKLKGGYERALSSSLFEGNKARVETQGLGGELQFVLPPWVEFGGGVARRTEDAFEQDGAARPGASHTTTTFGGFANVKPPIENLMVGVGYHNTHFQNFNIDAFGDPEKTTHQQMFGAVQYLLWDKLYVKYVLAYSRAQIEERNDSDPTDHGFTNQSIGHRVRLMLLY
jgi:hypothetical protein